MKNLNQNLILLLLLALPWGSRATHLVGGEMSYKCLGNNQYEVTIIIYRDCFNGNAALDDSVYVSIYDNSNQLISNPAIALFQQSLLPTTAPNNCTTFPPNICTEKGVYIDTFNLPPRPGGYTITHQRCCRNATISNIPTPGNWGNSYTIGIPSMDNCNTSPKYDSDPPVVLCLNQPINYDFSASESDSDSLYYELCELLHGGGQSNDPMSPINPRPLTPTPPPYTVVPYSPGFTVSSPITANPQFSINHQTGKLSGRPVAAGQYVFAVCVSEYRNGQLLSTNRRDFQFNVSNACRVTLARIADQNLNPQNLCSGSKIQFDNMSQFASSYFWDFGDLSTNADTSHAANPAYYYPDTGRYKVMLIADPGQPCADTTYKIFRVYDSVGVSFNYTGDFCMETNSFSFTPSGTYTGDATFQWDFNSNTNIGTGTTEEEPSGVRFPAPGDYPVSITVTDKGCSSSFTKFVTVYPNPEIDEIVETASECLPYTAVFQDQTEAYGPVQHFWFFGDGTTSNLPNPTHVYTTPGTFTVRHMIKTTQGCLDSGFAIYPDVITTFPVPSTHFSVSPREQSIYSPVFDVSSHSTGATLTETYLPDGRVIENMKQERLVLEDTGNFILKQISYNQYGCTDTLVDTIRVSTPFNLHVPSAFTPNGDGINDEFFFTVTDVRKAELYIFNRWGEVVFQSRDMYAKWNGRKMNRGEILPGGVYTYVLLLNVKKGGYTHREEGTVTLIR